MEMTPAKMVRLFLPTLLLLWAFSSGALRALVPYAEAYGGGDYLLEVSFKSNPKGILRGVDTDPMGFDGVLIYQGKEEKVTGELTQFGHAPLYQFDSSYGHFEGTLENVANRCEPRMKFTVTRNGRTVHTGYLQGAFCP
jgi:hypothetical protein